MSNMVGQSREILEILFEFGSTIATALARAAGRVWRSRHISKTPNCLFCERDQVPVMFQNVTSGAQPVASRLR